jgi:hypothetical protein
MCWLMPLQLCSDMKEYTWDELEDLDIRDGILEYDMSKCWECGVRKKGV